MQRSFSFISIFFSWWWSYEHLLMSLKCRKISYEPLIVNEVALAECNNPFCSVQFDCHWLISQRNWVKLINFLRWLSELWPFLGLQWKIQPNLSATLLWQSGVLARGRRHFWSFMPTSMLINMHYSQNLCTGQGCNTFTWDYCT